MDISSHLSIAVYCAENWKLLLARILFRFSCVRSKNNSTKDGQARTQVSFQCNFLIFRTISFHVAASVHISSCLLVCVCTFLFVDKIVYGLLVFGDACFSFCIKSFQIFRIIKLARRMFVFFTNLWNLGKISILLAFSGSFAVKNDILHIFFAVLVANFELPALPQTKIHGLDETVCTAELRPWKNQSDMYVG